MNETNQQLPAQLLLKWLSSDKSSANIVTLCEDLGSAARAKDFCGQLEAALGPRTVILDSVWSFDRLDRYDRCDIADSDVSGADIIIVSVRGDNRLRAYVRSWLEILMRARNGKPGAVVALIGQVKTSPHCAASIDSQLRHLADTARLDYFCSTNDTWKVKFNLSLTLCLAESGEQPIRDARAFDDSIRCLPSATCAHSTPPPWPLCSIGEPVRAPQHSSHCRLSNQPSRHLPANGGNQNLLDAGRIATQSNRGRQSVNGRGSEVEAKSRAGGPAEFIDSELVFSPHKPIRSLELTARYILKSLRLG